MSLTSVETVKLILGAGTNVEKIESAVKVIQDDAVYEYKKQIKGGINFIDTDLVDLVTDQYDRNGLRRYNAKNSTEGFVMVPDKDGFWTPAKG